MPVPGSRPDDRGHQPHTPMTKAELAYERLRLTILACTIANLAAIACFALMLVGR